LQRRRAIPTLLRAKQNLNADEAVSYSFPFSASRGGGEEAGDFQVGDVSNPGRLFGGDDETEQDDDEEEEEEEEEEEDGIYFDDDEDEENLFGDNDSSELDDNEEDTEAQIDLFRSSGGERGIMPSTEEKVNKLEELCARVRASGERTVTPEDIAGLYDFKFDKFQVQLFFAHFHRSS
jgi:hypothetical protein